MLAEFHTERHALVFDKMNSEPSAQDRHFLTIKKMCFNIHLAEDIDTQHQQYNADNVDQFDLFHDGKNNGICRMTYGLG